MVNKQKSAEKCIKNINAVIEAYYTGEFDTMEIPCECEKKEHHVKALYCSNCGRKLKRTAANDSL